MKQKKKLPIKVWRFECAPERYRDLSDHGGDEDWLAFVPDDYYDENINWMSEGTSFGCFRVSEHKVKGGIIRIGAHS